MINIDEKTLDQLAALGEGFTIEFKRSGTSGLGREICAFANATGGVNDRPYAANAGSA